MKAELINPFVVSMKNVLSTMAQIELEVSKPEKKTSERACGDVSGIIGMIGGRLRASMSVTFDTQFASSVMFNMLGEQHDMINDEVRDMVGEMTNMICGGAKHALSEQGYDFELATPVVVSGNGHTIVHKVDGARILLTFYSNKGAAYLEICFDS